MSSFTCRLPKNTAPVCQQLQVRQNGLGRDAHEEVDGEQRPAVGVEVAVGAPHDLLALGDVLDSFQVICKNEETQTKRGELAPWCSV